jgi:hypothetical protein
MKISQIAAVLRKASSDMQAIADQNNDLDYPDEVVLPLIRNFLTDEGLRKVLAQAPTPSMPLK